MVFKMVVFVRRTDEDGGKKIVWVFKVTRSVRSVEEVGCSKGCLKVIVMLHVVASETTERKREEYSMVRFQLP